MGTNEKASSTNPPFEFKVGARVRVFNRTLSGRRVFEGVGEIKRILRGGDTPGGDADFIYARVALDQDEGEQWDRVLYLSDQDEVRIPEDAVFTRGAVCPYCDERDTTYTFQLGSKLHWLCGKCGHEETEAVAHG